MPFDPTLPGYKDIIGGSKTEGYLRGRRTSAERLFLLTDPDGTVFTNTIGDLDIALAAVRTAEGNSHPVDSNLLMAQATATRFGPKKIYVTADYEYVQVSGFGGDQELVADYRPAIDTVKVFRSAYRIQPVAPPPYGAGYYWDWTDVEHPVDPITGAANTDDTVALNSGLPWGDLLLDNGGNVTWAWWKRPITKVTVHTNLTFNPYGPPSYIGYLENSVNSGVITMGGLGLNAFVQPHSVRFDGAQCGKFSNSSFWDVYYQFSIVHGKWYQQEGWDLPVSGAGANNVLIYEPKNFANVFPMGVGTPL